MSTSVIQAFKSLNVSGNSDDHQHIYEVSYQYLANIKNFDDPKSFGNCLVALINLDKYYKGADLIKKVPQELVHDFSIEVGYIYYKTGRTQELEQLYESVKSSSSALVLAGLKHILAQNYYRLGHNDKALSLCHELITSNSGVDSVLDLATNEFAIISQLNGTVASISSVVEENHDLLFNKALVLLAQGQLTSALNQLEQAYVVLQQQNFDDETFSIEKCSLFLIKAYIYHVQGRVDDSKQVLRDLDVIKYSDPMLTLLLKNNYYSLGDLLSNDNINLVDRELNYQQNLARLAPKLTHHQQVALVRNNVLLSYLSNTLTKKSSYLKASSIEQRVAENDYSLASFKLLLKLGITNDDLVEASSATSRKLFHYLNSADNFTEQVAGALVLLAVNHKQKKYNHSLIILEKLVQQSLDLGTLVPGLVGSLIKLYETVGVSQKVDQLYEQLVQKFQTIEIDATNYNFVKIVGVKLFSLNNSSAEKIFDVLNKYNPDDLLIKKFLGHTVQLQPVSKLIEDTGDVLNVNIETLVQAPRSYVIKSSGAKVQKKQVRKPKFGAAKVIKPLEDVKLDDERWLPMKLRSYYKPKKSKKKGGHQGAIEASPAPTTSPSPAPQAKAKKSKKKKGKK